MLYQFGRLQASVYLFTYGRCQFLEHANMAMSIVMPFNLLIPCKLTSIDGPKSGGSAVTPFDRGIPTHTCPGSQFDATRAALFTMGPK
mmetsp:Transcript_9680/g.15528  ORF Transcript_9680/g.15528 Transcript_9680/m.15528 type:complete len:88 (-) Transcript_9680:1882-2145(-)